MRRQSHKFKEFLLKLLDKMCKYEKDLTSICEDTERTQFCPQIDRRTSLENLISAAMKQAAPHLKPRRGWQYLLRLPTPEEATVEEVCSCLACNLVFIATFHK